MASSEAQASSGRAPGRGRIVVRVITRIVISLLLGAISYVATQAVETNTDPRVVLGIGVSVFVAGVAFIVQFLIEVRSEVDRTVHEQGDWYARQLATTHDLIIEEFRKVSAATELFGAVEASALKTNTVTQLVRHATSVPRNNPSLMFDFAQAEILRLSGYLRDLGHQADVAYDGEDRDWLLGLTQAATQSIDATSLTTVDVGGQGFVDNGLWGSEFGQRYLELQEIAIRRGVRIRRVFIIDRPDLKEDPTFIAVLNEHRRVGVEVRTLDPYTASPSVRPLLIDFIVFDGVLVYHSRAVGGTSNEGRPRIIETRLVTDLERVAREADRFQLLWAAGAPHASEGHVAQPIARQMPL